EKLLRVGDHERAAAVLVRLQQSMVSAGTSPARRIDAGRRWVGQISEDATLLPVARILLATAFGYGCQFDEARRELAEALALPSARRPLVGVLADVASAFYVDFWQGDPLAALGALDRAVE